jgi:hypothetical protein
MKLKAILTMAIVTAATIAIVTRSAALSDLLIGEAA